jgi:transmembrane sensor
VTDAAVRQEAAAWVVRLGGRVPTPDEIPEFDAWLRSNPHHAIAYDDASRTWRDLAAMRQSEHYGKLLGTPTLRERIVSALNVPRWAIAAGSVAAAAVVAWLVLGSDALRFFNDTKRVETRVAEIHDLTLPDGSQVSVGARSQFDFEITREQRRATIIDGDAFFSVTKDPARPFYVTVGDVQVKVVGTQFEVRRRGDDVSVAVLEGIVEVTRRDGDAAQVLHLRRGEAVTAGPGAGGAVHAVNTEDVGAWRSGRLVYDNVELRDVIADANRYGRTRIVIADSQVASLRITTSFRASQVDGLIETLQNALPLAVERQPGGDILLRARE